MREEKKKTHEADREDIAQYSLIKLKCRLWAMEPNNAKITFLLQKIGLCDNSMIWIMKKWYKLDEPFSSLCPMKSRVNVHFGQRKKTTLIKVSGKSKEVKCLGFKKLQTDQLKTHFLYNPEYPTICLLTLCIRSLHISTSYCCLFI